MCHYYKQDKVIVVLHLLILTELLAVSQLGKDLRRRGLGNTESSDWLRENTSQSSIGYYCRAELRLCHVTGIYLANDQMSQMYEYVLYIRCFLSRLYPAEPG